MMISEEQQLKNLLSYTKADLADEILRLYQKEDRLNLKIKDLFSLIKLQEIVERDVLRREQNLMVSMNANVLLQLMGDAGFRGYNPYDPHTVFKFGEYLKTRCGKPNSKAGRSSVRRTAKKKRK
ncbi:TPA: hypothetical protein NJ597_001240 [Vibrio parahaemolyticus]|nr:hypothetical protein [Vibrio parahaemolyticus]